MLEILGGSGFAVGCSCEKTLNSMECLSSAGWSSRGLPHHMESACPRNFRALWIAFLTVILLRPGCFVVSFTCLTGSRVGGDASNSLWRYRPGGLHVLLKNQADADDRLVLFSLSYRELTEGLSEFVNMTLFLLAFLFPPLSVRVHSSLTSTWRSSLPMGSSRTDLERSP